MQHIVKVQGCAQDERQQHKRGVVGSVKHQLHSADALQNSNWVPRMRTEQLPSSHDSIEMENKPRQPERQEWECADGAVGSGGAGLLATSALCHKKWHPFTQPRSHRTSQGCAGNELESTLHTLGVTLLTSGKDGSRAVPRAGATAGQRVQKGGG